MKIYSVHDLKESHCRIQQQLPIAKRLNCAKQCLTLHLNRSTGALDMFVIADILWL